MPRPRWSLRPRRAPSSPLPRAGRSRSVSRKGNITLVDKDRDLSDPVVILNGVDVNRGNKQIGHAIDRVLLPIDV